MNGDNDNQSEFVAKCALLLMLGGLIMPLVIAVLAFVLPGTSLSPTTAQVGRSGGRSRAQRWAWGVVRVLSHAVRSSGRATRPFELGRFALVGVR
jgi:hypothetical protein